MSAYNIYSEFNSDFGTDYQEPGSRFGFLGLGHVPGVDDVGDAISSGIDKALDVFTSAVDAIPGGRAVREAAGDFAKTSVGQVLTKAIASTFTAGIASFAGPQIASVAFAVPGLAEGKGFSEAWLTEFKWRVEKTIEIVSPQVGQMLSNQITEVLKQLPHDLPFDAKIKESIQDFAKKYNIREDAAAFVKSIWNKEPPPNNLDFDFPTGKYTAGVKNIPVRGLGRPNITIAQSVEIGNRPEAATGTRGMRRPSAQTKKIVDARDVERARAQAEDAKKLKVVKIDTRQAQAVQAKAETEQPMSTGTKVGIGVAAGGGLLSLGYYILQGASTAHDISKLVK